jgi:hypothetical protein
LKEESVISRGAAGECMFANPVPYCPTTAVTNTTCIATTPHHTTPHTMAAPPPPSQPAVEASPEDVCVKVAGALRGVVRLPSYEAPVGALRAEVARLLGACAALSDVAVPFVAFGVACTMCLALCPPPHPQACRTRRP